LVRRPPALSPSLAARCMSAQAPRPKGFIGTFVDNIKEGMNKDKQMKENLKKFREEKDKLEQSEALLKAREKFQAIEKESRGAVSQTLDSLGEKARETLSEAERAELVQKAKKVGAEVGAAAAKVQETVAAAGGKIADTDTAKTVRDSAAWVGKEVDTVTMSRAHMYRPPTVLRKRSVSTFTAEVAPDAETTGVELHKDSRFAKAFKDFKENNPYVNKMFSLKMQYDESDHVAVRASRAVSDKFQQLLGGVFQRTTMSEVLTEIHKMEPNFDKEEWVGRVRDDIIPNVLEATVRGDLEVLQDWCSEACYSQLSAPAREAAAAGAVLDARVLDVSHVDVVTGQMMEPGPVLCVSFQAHLTQCVRDAKTGAVVTGDPDKILKVHYVWALCRDQTELDPNAAWRLVEYSASSGEQWL